MLVSDARQQPFIFREGSVNYHCLVFKCFTNSLRKEVKRCQKLPMVDVVEWHTTVNFNSQQILTGNSYCKVHYCCGKAESLSKIELPGLSMLSQGSKSWHSGLLLPILRRLGFDQSSPCRHHSHVSVVELGMHGQFSTGTWCHQLLHLRNKGLTG